MKAEQMKKAFKTRCKRCSHVIVVRPEDHAGQEPAQAQATPQAESSPSAVQWYAVVNGEQGGPYTVDQLAEYYQAGMLTVGSYVWRDGMANWTALEGVSELQGELARRMQQSSPQASAVATPQVAQHHEPEPAQSHEPEPAQRREPAQARQPEAEILTSSNSAYVESMTSVPRGAASTPQTGGAAADLGQLTNQRNENSVLFSLDSIDGQGITVHNAVAQPRAETPRPVVTNTGGSEGSGLIDLSALASLTGGGAAQGDRGQIVAPINIGAGATRGSGRPSLTSGRTDYKTIALVVMATALVGVVGVFSYQTWFAPKPPVQQMYAVNQAQPQGSMTAASTQKNVEQRVVASAAQSGQKPDQAASAPAEPSQPLAKKQSESAQKPKRSKRGARSTQRKRSSRKNRAKQSQRTSTARSKPPAAPRRSTRSSSSRRKKPSGGGEAASLLSGIRGGSKKPSAGKGLNFGGASKPAGPKKPSKKAIMSTLRSVNLNTCLNRDPSLRGKGSIKVQIVAISSGAITRARVVNQPYKSSPVGACLEREVKRKRFPRFTDSQIKFTFPFRN